MNDVILLAHFLVLASVNTALYNAQTHKCPDVTDAAREPNHQSAGRKLRLELVKGGFYYPVFLTHSPEGRYLFILEQRGVIKQFDTKYNETSTFADLRSYVLYARGTELGLLGLALHPDYPDNNKVFVYYSCINSKRLCTVVEELIVKDCKITSQRLLLKIPQPFSNHNGGMILFGDDRKLYIGTGDGGGAGDPYNNSQDLRNLLGKILRIDVDNKSDGREYAIPADNPFTGDKKARHEIWAYGLRNPWRFSIDPVTKLMFCGDVGQWKEEEINILQKGGNYGWSLYEGNLRFKASEEKLNDIKPILTYGRKDGVSVTGGYVYRGKLIRELAGTYIYADFQTKNIWGLKYDAKANKVVSNELLLVSPDRVSSFGIDRDGELYVLGYDTGRIYKLTAN